MLQNKLNRLFYLSVKQPAYYSKFTSTLHPLQNNHNPINHQHPIYQSGYQLLSLPARHFPRTIYKEQKHDRDSAYKFRTTVDQEARVQYQDAKSRKDFEIMKEGDRLYKRFNIDQSSQDAEYEKDLDRLIDEKIAQGYDDARIIDELSNYGEAKNTLTQDEVDKMEQKKIQELKKSLKQQGLPQKDLGDITIGDGFEEFQQRSGKMMYETDVILDEKWKAEEKTRRERLREQAKKQIEERKQLGPDMLIGGKGRANIPRVDTSKLLKSSDKSNILKTTKIPRSIEPSVTFGYSQPTENVSAVLPQENEQNLTRQFNKYSEDNTTVDDILDKVSDRDYKRALQKGMIKSSQNEQKLSKNEQKSSDLTQLDYDEMDQIDPRLLTGKQKLAKNNELTPKEKETKKRLKKEIENYQNLAVKDREFKDLVEAEEINTKKALGQYIDEEETKIVGKQARTKVENMDQENQLNKLSTEQKIQRELSYMTQALDLDIPQQKHWFYKLRREYKEQEKLQERLKQKEARKQFMKLLKSYKLPEVLQQEEDFEKLYDSDVIPHLQPKKDEEPLPPGYENEKDWQFYGDDVDFMRFHKRTKDNIYNCLVDLINSNKQTISKGVSQNQQLMINHIQLNKASSLVDVWWQLAILPDHATKDREFIAAQVRIRKDEIDAFKERKIQEQIQQQNEEAEQEKEYVEEVEIRKAADKIKDDEWLEQLDKERLRIVEAEIQKKLTKASKYLRGEICQRLGLRYAPELRFFKDNSIQIYKNIEQQAIDYLNDLNKQKEQQKMPGVNRQLLEQRESIIKMMKYTPDQAVQLMDFLKGQDDQEQLQAFEYMVSKGGAHQALAEIDEQIKQQLERNKKIQKENAPDSRYKRRAEERLRKYKDKVSLASGEDFDTLANAEMTTGEIEESLLGAVSTIVPTKHDLDEQRGNKFKIDPNSGQKIRINKENDHGKNSGKSKSERKQDRSLAFWSRL
eukprot:403364431